MPNPPARVVLNKCMTRSRFQSPPAKKCLVRSIDLPGDFAATTFEASLRASTRSALSRAFKTRSIFSCADNHSSGSTSVPTRYARTLACFRCFRSSCVERSCFSVAMSAFAHFSRLSERAATFSRSLFSSAQLASLKRTNAIATTGNDRTSSARHFIGKKPGRLCSSAFHDRRLHLAFLVDHMLAHNGIVLAQLHAVLGVVAVLLQVIAMRALAALHFDVIAGVFALLGHGKLPKAISKQFRKDYSGSELQFRQGRWP